MLTKTHPTWEEITLDSIKLSTLIQSPHLYSGIIGVARGGLPITAIVANALKIRCVYSVLSISYNDDGVQGKQHLSFPDCPKDGRYLIIDDLVDSGRTIKVLKEHYPESDIAVIDWKVGVEGQVAKPDYYVNERDSESWIVYPWEVGN